MNQDTKTLNKRIKKHYVYRVIDSITCLAFIIPFFLPKEINSSSVYFIAPMSIVLLMWMINKVFTIRYLYKDKDDLSQIMTNQSPKKYTASWKAAFIASIVELIICVFVIIPLMIVFYIKQDDTFAFIITVIMSLELAAISSFPSNYFWRINKELKNKRHLQIQQ